MKKLAMLTAALVVIIAIASAELTAGGKKLAGNIKVDGSSTVYLITEAMATNFKKLHPDVNVSVGISGTGGGFKKFAAGETDISDSSRRIKASEAKKCKDNGIEFVELQVAWDGLAVIIHKDNDFALKMTVEQLKKIWRPGSPAKKWSEVDPSWPNEEIKLYGAGPDSGTFDYFTEEINGKSGVSRTDYTASEDDLTTVKGVARNKYAMGYLGLAYYEANKDKLRVVSIKNTGGKEFFPPNQKNVLTNKYAPLSRPLFIYVKIASLKRPEVQGFLDYYLRRGDLVTGAKYVPMGVVDRFKSRQKLEKAVKSLK